MPNYLLGGLGGLLLAVVVAVGTAFYNNYYEDNHRRQERGEQRRDSRRNCGQCNDYVNLNEDDEEYCDSCHTLFHRGCARRLERRLNGRVCSTCRSVIETNERCGLCINSVNLTDDRLVNCGSCHTSFHGECARRLERRQNGRVCSKCYSFINTNEVVRDERNCLICRQSLLVGDDDVVDLIRCRSCSQMYHSRCARVGAFNIFNDCVSCGDGMELDE